MKRNEWDVNFEVSRILEKAKEQLALVQKQASGGANKINMMKELKLYIKLLEYADEDCISYGMDLEDLEFFGFIE